MAITLQAKSSADVNSAQEKIDHFFKMANQVILGKEEQLRLCLCAILSEGHILIEDLPGVGKTTLVKLLAKGLGLESNRVQFTNDMLPADILGTSIFNTKTQMFDFHKGPLFSQIVIADELNRATPKTQSALLQAMEEQTVSIEGKTFPLPQPFFVVATQNPQEQSGTYPLPESQLDRFLMRLHLGYPDKEAEKDLLRGERRDKLIAQAQSVFSSEEILALQQLTANIFAADAIVDYVQRLLDYSRNQGESHWGLSPRAGLALIRAAKSWAFLAGRKMVVPEDVQAVAPAVIAHRLNLYNGHDVHMELSAAQEIIKAVPVD